MSSRGENEKQALIDRVAAAAKRGQGRKAAAVERFVRRFYANVPTQDCAEMHADTLRGAAMSLWDFAQVRTPGQSKVRVFNPAKAECGWQPGHTVVEIVNDDMSFLVDSVTAELNHRNLTVHLLIHPVLTVTRDKSGRLTGMPEDGAGGQGADGEGARDGGGFQRESVMHLQITEQTDPARLRDLEDGIEAVLADVRAAVDDWRPMRVRLADVIASLDSLQADAVQAETKETADFLRWLENNNFTFLGYREADLRQSGRKQVLATVPGSGLGLLRDPTVGVIDGIEDGAVLPPDLAAFLQRPSLTLINKANRRSTVHRGVHLDAILIKKFDASGRAVGHRMFIGLFTSSVYNQAVDRIPVIRQKVRRVLDRSGFSPSSHDGKSLLHILETLPRDELFQIGERELRETALGILHLQERQRVALFVRRDPFGRYVSCLVYLPRERYETRLRRRIHEVLEIGFGGTVTAFYTQLTDEVLARLHYIVKTEPGRPFPRTDEQIEADIAEAARDWYDDLAQSLARVHGESSGVALFDNFRNAFPAGYRDRFLPAAAVSDIAKIARTGPSGAIAMDLYRPHGADEASIRFKMFNRGESVPLSDVLPMLENMGLRVIDEIPYEIRLTGGESVWIHDFGMVSRNGGSIDIGAVKDAFEETFGRVWRTEVENDGFNGLVIAAGLTWRQIVVLRGFCKYLRQAGIPFSEAYMVETLGRNAGIACDIVVLFETLFAPGRPGDDPEDRERGGERIRKRIDGALDAVQNVDEDRILRRFLNVADSTLRTNFYQCDEDGNPKPYFSFKLDSAAVVDLPLPRPLYEVFVYSPRMEGIHLRGGKVARGGIRWSDRREDFRTEILGLMKAQMPKNAIIVPVGAKGGFVLKRPPASGGREALLEEGIACYRLLMFGLLDITDNIVAGEVVPPADVVRRDSDDPYLVVAADKGTATFSDIANGVARDYGFWLDDAFASGGSAGYDHKKMGITARGAWESVKRHFRELGLDIQNEKFTAVGVGDMSGDVFGNGMLLSKHIRLVGAFNHLHIFIDPDPDAAASFGERRRLFRKGRSSWSDYDTALISKGGGVFERSAKAIKVSPQMRALFDLPARETVTPGELIRAVLQAKADLLWFGGIGTYVKASDESNESVGDRVNDPLRIDGRQIGARVVGEGANLGVTQLGRIEYALRGGRINTDFIDNSAGVASSDHEVNIKILLGAAIADGELDLSGRNRLLVKMTRDVAAHVLLDNYRQSMALSQAEARAAESIGEAARFIRALERAGELNRAVEFLPDDEELDERRARRQGLTRPELAVLLAYGKMTLYNDLLASSVPDDPWLVRDIGLYFPPILSEKFGRYLENHRLRREISATYITNSLINRAGPTFITDIANETGAGPDRIARAYLICRHVFGLRQYWAQIEALDNKVPAAVQTELNRDIQTLIRRGTIWFIERTDRTPEVAEPIESFAPGIAALAGSLDDYLSEELSARVDGEAARYVERGVPAGLARGVAHLDVLFAGCDIVRIARRSGQNVGDTARTYYAIGARYGFDWLRAQAETVAADNEWQAMAVSATIDDLYDQQARLTGAIIDTAGSASVAAVMLDAWEAAREHEVSRVRQTLADLRRAGTIDLAMLAVATRYIRSLLES
ncbi:MAG: NAD-glutamate dehydrogenase [Rhodospirillaceae bacterium]